MVAVCARGLRCRVRLCGRAGEWRLRDSLPVEWEGRDIVVTGVIRGLPVIDETGARLLFVVESNDAGWPVFRR